MRRPIFISLFLLGPAVFSALPRSHGQLPKSSDGYSAPGINPAKQRDLTKLTIGQRHFYLSGQRGMEWLQRANKPDGRFLQGFMPALGLRMEGDSYVRQAGAAFALARAAKFYGNERAAAIASQALLTLLLETSIDPKETQVRNIPLHLANPLVSGGILLAAIHELPTPAADLLDQADQLANMLRQQIHEDGSFAEEGKSGNLNGEAVRNNPGPALFGIIHSQPLRPAAWKLEALRRSRAYYHAYWKQNKNLPMTAWHAAAYTEAYFLTKETVFAEAVFDMNDWLLGLQYQQLDSSRASWVGGFQPWVDGTPIMQAPDIGSAGALVSLADGCRLAKAVGDARRYQRYRQALENGLQFLTSLQYSEANTQHFAEWYRTALVGGFHASGQDGNLRLDYALLSLSALVQYLNHVADLP